MEKLRDMINSLISELDARSPHAESVDWYLLNNMRRFRDLVATSPSGHDLKNGVRVLNRFCIDSMEWNDPMFKAVTALAEQAERAIEV